MITNRPKPHYSLPEMIFRSTLIYASVYAVSAMFLPSPAYAGFGKTALHDHGTNGANGDARRAFASPTAKGIRRTASAPCMGNACPTVPVPVLSRVNAPPDYSSVDFDAYSDTVDVKKDPEEEPQEDSIDEALWAELLDMEYPDVPRYAVSLHDNPNYWSNDKDAYWGSAEDNNDRKPWSSSSSGESSDDSMYPLPVSVPMHRSSKKSSLKGILKSSSSRSSQSSYDPLSSTSSSSSDDSGERRRRVRFIDDDLTQTSDYPSDGY